MACTIADAKDAAGVGYSRPLALCDVHAPKYALPPHPPQSVCAGDFGNWILLERSAKFVCAGGALGVGPKSYTSWFDPQHNPGTQVTAMLGYGNSIQFLHFLCSSTKSGIRCTNTDTGAGFVQSTDRYRFFG